MKKIPDGLLEVLAVVGIMVFVSYAIIVSNYF